MTRPTRRLWLRRAVAAFVVTASAGVIPIGRTSSPAAQASPDFEFYRANVEPIFMKSRGEFQPPNPGLPACVGCHTWQANTPLKLERLQENARGGVEWTAEQSRRNYDVVLRLVMPGAPDNSRLLLKPLAVAAGGAQYHVGGKFWTSKDDPEWKVMAEWVRKITPGPSKPFSGARVDFAFFQSCVQPIFVNPLPGAVRCTECHGGNGGFAREPSEGRKVWNEEESRANFQVLSRFVVPGFPTQSRFLMHPLHPDGGGDYAHNGVKRWKSQDDPEWRMLAAWVRGERTGTTCQR